MIHMLLGKLKAGDIPRRVRDACHPQDGGAVLPAEHRADHRLRLRHALRRSRARPCCTPYSARTCGCTHLIVGRDHAGVGDYYGAFDAQTIFDEEVPEGALEIEIFKADHTAYSKKLNKVVMMRDVPDHTKEDFVLLSGTKVREMLAQGTALPPEFSRPEVAEILMDYYQANAN